ncbi:MAG: MBL fold metallo-hydrolase [Firmicutes bacterium]|nr:MBL fold metallo-hydrolase [Bacillota bacterium]
MIWQPLQDPELGCMSYIIGDPTSGEGIAVDPLGALGAEAYILAAQDLGLALVEVIETHVHADHASSAQELATALGIPHGLSHRAPASYAFHALKDGDVMALGQVSVTIWETPGHTPDSISLVVTDERRGQEPWLVLTGDSLFVGDVGRPDLADADPGAIRKASEDQYSSVHRLMDLPDYTEVWPAHYGSSPCGGLFMDKKPNSTIGYERRFNPFLNMGDLETFVAQQQRLLKPPPEEAQELRRRNLGVTS